MGKGSERLTTENSKCANYFKSWGFDLVDEKPVTVKSTKAGRKKKDFEDLSQSSKRVRLNDSPLHAISLEEKKLYFEKHMEELSTLPRNAKMDKLKKKWKKKCYSQ